MALQLSIIIIGRNEGERLLHCIRSVQAMDFPREAMEIIYVDSASTDGSPERAKSLGVDKVLEVRPERPAAAIGRNAGWKVAQAPYLLFLDGDTLLHPEFVKVGLRCFEDPQVAVVCGHRREITPPRSLYQRVLDLDWVYPTGTTAFCGGDALIRHDVLDSVQGYDPTLIAGEDPELCHRIRSQGYQIVHLDQMMTQHDLGIHTWSQYWLRGLRDGHAYAEVSHRLRHSPLPLWKRESRKNWLHAGGLVTLTILSLVGAIGLNTVWPIGLLLIFLALLALRTAWRARWKSTDKWTLLLYGIHAHIHPIPIAMGQLSYHYHRWRGQRKQLIEYK